MKRPIRILTRCMAAFLLAFFATPADAILVADLKGDYQNATAVGQTTADALLYGTFTGLWNYYSDDDGVIDGDEELLTFVNQIGGSGFTNGDPGYGGNNRLFGAGNYQNYPAVSSNLVLLQQYAPLLTPGVLQVHTGDPNQPGNDVLALRYMATGAVNNVSINYQLQIVTHPAASIDYKILHQSGGSITSVVPTSSLFDGQTTGILSASVPDLATGDSIWFVIDSGLSRPGANPIADAVNVGLAIFGDPEHTMTLRVDRTSGGAWLTGPVGTSFAVTGYSISSNEGALNAGSWNPLQNNPSYGNGNPNDLSGWEALGAGSAYQIGEFNPDGSNAFGDGGTADIFLGNIFNTNGAENLQLSFSLDGIGVLQGVVEYFTGAPTAGDYNQDGIVNLADYTVWRDNLGGTSLPNETASPGVVDAADYLIWKQNFGAPAAAVTADGSRVPEPSTVLLAPLLFALGGVGLKKRLAMNLGRCLVLLICCATASFTYAARTVDRDYRLGDDPAESNAAAGVPVGTYTYDTAGSSPEDWHDLTKVGNPVYADVSSRPYVTAYGGSTLGITFSGNGDYLQGLAATQDQGLGSPGSISSPNPAYANITTRGIQMWVLPTASGTGDRQDLINDTFQFGIYISELDTWGMTWGARAFSPTPQVYGSSQAVTFNQWAHVHQHSVGNHLGVLYVNGVAVAASAPGETYQINEFSGASVDIVVGASLELDGSDAFAGTMDDIEIYVAGSNAMSDYGTFSLEEDNAFISNYLSANNYVLGDLTGDGIVSGNGSGGASDDVALFVSNWNTRKVISGSLVGDLDTRLMGDFNYDGIVDLFDWAILRNNHLQGGSLNLAQLLHAGSHTVPEPATWGIVLAFLGLLCGARRLSCTKLCSTHTTVRLLPFLMLLTCVPTAGAVGLWNVDFQGTAGSTAYGQAGVSKNYGPDPISGVWNVLEAEAVTSDPQEIFTDSPSLSLVDNDGNASSVVLTLHGPVAGWNGMATQHALYGDYVIIAPGISGFPAGPLRMTLSGLQPSQAYSMKIDTGPAAGRTMVVAVDADGNGTVANDTTTSILANTRLDATPTFKFISDAAGNAIAEFSPPSGVAEADLAALQLKIGEFLPTLTIDRSTGAMTLANDTVTDSYQVTGYSIASNTVGALNPQAWMSIADHHDADGSGQIDSEFNWFEFTSSTDRDNLSETQEIVNGAVGFDFTDGDSIFLGNAWIPNPVEDVKANLLVRNSQGLAEVVSVDVIFTGAEHLIGDFDNDGLLTTGDWSLLKSGFSSIVTDLSQAEKYRLGDINLDGAIDLRDAHRFVQEFESLNGIGSFAAAVGARVPEPSTALLLTCIVGAALCRHRLASRSK